MKIAQVIQSDSWGDISPKAFERGIGGREGALVRLATEWARMGHEVTNFVPIDKSQRYEGSISGDLTISDKLHQKQLEEFKNRKGTFRPPDATPSLFHPALPRGFHEYVPAKLAKHMLRAFPYDAVVAWECPSVFADDDIVAKQKVRLVHMQVAHLDDHENAERYSTGVVALSEWARDFLLHSGLEMSDKMYVRPNGVDLWSFPREKAIKKVNSKNPSFVYSSSPDRGLWHLLKMWPEIRREYKKANLFVGYGVTGYTEQIRWAHSRIGEMSTDIEKLMEQPGVVDIGKVGQRELANLQLKASAWLYPCDSIQATETGCITAIENMAAGNFCVMSDADCLESEFESVAQIEPLPFFTGPYLDDLDDFFSAPKDEQKETIERARDFAEQRDWAKIAPTWIELFKDNNA
jgi:glycosyltransferase involved in cell wall biosynthesis